ncbi:uncharacterized protein [Watersipora subatra]|uniref:uncharacterized protein isoform X2 n=1 Tax=Watersipora subatra TaxID=2589382 RepID=UPI00355BE9C6
MDGQQQFLKPAQHVPFYVKRPITLDTSSHPHIFGYENGGKASSYSVDLSHSRFSRPRHMDQLSEPVIKTQSKSLRDVFEKAILNGEVAIHSPEEEPGVFRNPSFITASLPRPEKLNKLKQKSATIGGDNYLHLGIAHHRSTDNFVDSDSGSDTDPGRHNDAYLDDASSTISDELFKASSDGPEQLQPEEEFNIQPLPHLLDIDSHQAGRSTLGGFFKPKYRDYPHNNVHRTSERQHKEVIDCGTGRQSGKRGNSLHRQLPNSIHRDDSLRGYSTAFPTNGRDVGKLPRTRFPNATSPENYSSQSRDVDHSVEMSHNRYLPKKRRSSHSPRRHSPRLSSGQETAFNDLEDIVPASPELPRATSRHQSGEGRVDSDGAPLEQMEMEQPVWAKAEMREIRRRRRRRICCGLSALVFVIAIGTAIGVGLMIARNTDKNGDKVPPSLTPILISSTRSGESPSPKPTSSIYSTTTTEPPGIQNITLTFDGSMRITNLNFTNDLNDPESPRAQSLSTQFCDTMEDVFDPTVKNSDYTYQQCQVTNFTKGSILMQFHLEFSTQVEHYNGTQQDISLKSDEILSSIKVELKNPTYGLTWEVDSIAIDMTSKIIDEGKNGHETTGSDHLKSSSATSAVTMISTDISSVIKMSTSLVPVSTPTSILVHNRTSSTFFRTYTSSGMPITTPVTTTTLSAILATTTSITTPTTAIRTTTPTTVIRTTTPTTATTTTTPTTTTATPKTTTTTPTTTPTTARATTTTTAGATTAPSTTSRITTTTSTTELRATSTTAIETITTFRTLGTTAEPTATLPTTMQVTSISTPASNEETNDQITDTILSTVTHLVGCAIDFFGTNCQSIYFTCNGSIDEVVCDREDAISLSSVRLSWDDSMCSIPVRRPATPGQSLPGCPSYRLYQLYNCSNPSFVPLLPMADFGYTPECCSDRQYFNETLESCAECGGDCPPGDSSSTVY